MTVTWRSFKFLQAGDGRKVDFSGPTTCCSAGREDLFFGCEGGVVHVLDKSLQDKITFTAYGHNVLQMYDFQKRHCLLTIGTEEAGVSSTVLKCWNLDQLFPGRGNAAQPLKTHKLFNSKFPEADVTCMCVHEWEENNAIVAIGLASGFVYWFSGDTVNHKVNMNRLDARPLGSDLWCVKGMGFSDVGGLHLFVVTESQTLVFNLRSERKTVLDEAGAGDGGILIGDDGQLLVPRPQALYFYTVEGRGACFAFNEQHHHLAWAGRNLVVVHETIMANGASSSEVKFFDLGNKLVVGQKPVVNVKHIISIWDMVIVVQGDGTILSWSQIPLVSKLEALFRRNCHSIALRLAEDEGASTTTLAHIYQQYGDHLYHDKRDYETAMQQYLCTIGNLEPSYVIRKYLDAQRIQQLTLYLEALHNDGRANADHTTLLLNCYTKLKDVEKLDKFVGIGEASGDGQENGSTQRKYDIETAIKVLRGAGYYSHALEIARSANEPFWYLDILLEDQGDYDEGIKYVFQLPREKAAEAMNRYGKVLVTHRPRDSTGCLMKLCVPEQSKIEDPVAEFAADVSDYTHLYSDKLGALVELCEFVFLVHRHLSKPPPGESHLYHTLLELYLSDSDELAAAQQGSSQPTQERGPSDEFGAKLPSKEERLEKAKALLHQGWTPGESPKYDPEHVLVLCRMHGFTEGLVFLYERKGLLREVLQVYIAAKDYTGIIEACRNYGDAFRGGDPQLWSEALEYFSSRTEDCTEQVQEVLRHIERQEVLPPLVVLQTLAKNSSLKLKIVKSYIAAQLQKDSKSIAEDRKEITRLTLETAEMRKQIHELKTEPQVCQGHVDEQTKQPLELPAVHFLCHHSFNLRTLGDDAAECPICRVQNQEILRIRRDMKAGVAHQDQFFMELKGNKDGFGVVAEWFGRGMLNVRSMH